MARKQQPVAPPATAEDAPDYRMSEVFRAFTAPFLRGAQEYDDIYFGYLLAALAWNLSFLPPHERIRMLMSELQRIPEPSRFQAKELIAAMIQRKEQAFAHYTRWIVDYALEDRGRQYDLTVRSAPLHDLANPTAAPEEPAAG